MQHLEACDFCHGIFEFFGSTEGPAVPTDVARRFDLGSDVA
jgi:hypothetical protein